jgi:hypothetical protein
MKDEELDNVFKDLNFDVFEPEENHEEAFLKKLNAQSIAQAKHQKGTIFNLWKPLLSVAACVLVGVFLFKSYTSPNHVETADLASVSKEMKQTQDFYSVLITSELSKLEQQQTPETKQLIDDTMRQLNVLEKDYQKLKKDLVDSGEDKRVIYAMVTNFQQRTALLQNVLETIENIQKLKEQDNESNIL